MGKELKFLGLLIKVTLSYIVNSVVLATPEANFSGLAWESNNHFETFIQWRFLSYGELPLNLKADFPWCSILPGWILVTVTEGDEELAPMG